jgi:GNAT superfamily N-acetyltransferase
MIIITTPKSKEEFKAYYALRYRVLREKFGLPKGTEKDDYEPISLHFIAVDDQKQEEILGAVKMFEKAPGIAQFSHLAVDENQQGKGIGKLLVDTVEEHAHQMGFKTIGTATRLTATGFYEKLGYRVIGVDYLMIGRMQTVWMEKSLEATPPESKS